MLHNTFSFIFFFAFAEFLGLYKYQTTVISSIVSMDFLRFVGSIFVVIMVPALFGRILAFILMWGYAKKSSYKVMKAWNNLNQGINKIGMVFLISSLVNSLVYAVGFHYILAQKLPIKREMLSLILAYIIIKIIVYVPIHYKFE